MLGAVRCAHRVAPSQPLRFAVDVWRMVCPRHARAAACVRPLIAAIPGWLARQSARDDSASWFRPHDIDALADADRRPRRLPHRRALWGRPAATLGAPFRYDIVARRRSPLSECLQQQQRETLSTPTLPALSRSDQRSYYFFASPYRLLREGRSGSASPRAARRGCPPAARQTA